MGKENNKICIVGPSLKMGGMERASANLANSIYKIGNDVTYLSFFNQEKFFRLEDGVKFIEPVDFNITSLSILKSLKWIRRKIKVIQPDRIIVFNKFYSALVLLALIGTNSKVFISERSSPLFKWNFKHEAINRLIFWMIKPYGIIDFISPYNSDKYVNRNHKNDIIFIVELIITEMNKITLQISLE